MNRRDPYSVGLVVTAVGVQRPAGPRGRARRAAGRDDRPARRRRVRAAADALADGGYEVVDTAPPRYEDVVATWTAFIVADIRMMRGESRR